MKNLENIEGNEKINIIYHHIFVLDSENLQKSRNHRMIYCFVELERLLHLKNYF
jgi:hypothetical protein